MAQADDLRQQIDNLYPGGVPGSVRCAVCDTWMLPAIFTNGAEWQSAGLLICIVCVMRVMPDATGGWLD